MARVEIIGGGLAGLVAAVTVAEGGGEATLIEANAQLGGRACTQAGAYRSNFGPHALYLGGEMEIWLRQRDLLPALTHPKTSAVKLVPSDGGLGGRSFTRYECQSHGQDRNQDRGVRTAHHSSSGS